MKLFKEWAKKKAPTVGGAAIAVTLLLGGAPASAEATRVSAPAVAPERLPAIDNGEVCHAEVQIVKGRWHRDFGGEKQLQGMEYSNGSWHDRQNQEWYTIPGHLNPPGYGQVAATGTVNVSNYGGPNKTVNYRYPEPGEQWYPSSDGWATEAQFLANATGLGWNKVATKTFTEQGNRIPCVIPVPAQPSHNDPCGSNNATWNVPGDTDKVVWTLHGDGRLVANTTQWYVFEGGGTSKDFGIALDSNEPCPPTEWPHPVWTEDCSGLDSWEWSDPSWNEALPEWFNFTSDTGNDVTTVELTWRGEVLQSWSHTDTTWECPTIELTITGTLCGTELTGRFVTNPAGQWRVAYWSIPGEEGSDTFISEGYSDEPFVIDLGETYPSVWLFGNSQIAGTDIQDDEYVQVFNGVGCDEQATTTTEAPEETTTTTETPEPTTPTVPPTDPPPPVTDPPTETSEPGEVVVTTTIIDEPVDSTPPPPAEPSGELPKTGAAEVMTMIAAALVLILTGFGTIRFARRES